LLPVFAFVQRLSIDSRESRFAEAGLQSSLRPGEGIRAMRTFATAAAILLWVLPAQAQMKRPKSDDTRTEQKKPHVDDKAYQDALKRIPEPKEKYDPWGVTKKPAQ
jgi:Defensin propeptide